MIIFLDACAIIYWVEMVSPYYDQFARTLLSLNKKGKKPSFAASELSLLECRIRPLRDQNEELLDRYQQFFCASDLKLIPVSLTILEEAARLRAFQQLRTPDAIHAASALSISDNVVFVTGDVAFKKITSLEVILI